MYWKYLIGLYSGAVYGGRIECIEDMQIMNTYLNQFFNDGILNVRWKPFGIPNNIPLTSKLEVYILQSISLKCKKY